VVGIKDGIKSILIKRMILKYESTPKSLFLPQRLKGSKFHKV
jgi:hypothetical protein